MKKIEKNQKFDKRRLFIKSVANGKDPKNNKRRASFDKVNVYYVVKEKERKLILSQYFYI